MVQTERTVRFVVTLALGACGFASPAAADLSLFAAVVGFDNDANLDSAPGIGLRWGRSSGILAGETALMISRPERSAEGSAETATAIFYEGRLLVNMPVGAVKPFVGVGFGAITITGTDLEIPAGTGEAGVRALKALSDLQNNKAFSYGAGLRYALNERVDARIDLRQYQVFSVKAAVRKRVADRVGGALGELVEDESTVQYNELSAGIVFRF